MRIILTFLTLLLALSSGYRFSGTAAETDLVQIEAIEIDRDRVQLPCEPEIRGHTADEMCHWDNPPLKVSVKIKNPKNIAVRLRYSVTGGQLYGDGPNVMWRVSGVRKGESVITASLEPGEGIDPTPVSRTVLVTGCMCEYRCWAPTLTIASDGIVSPGDQAVFSAIEPKGLDVEYRWMIDRGRIISGQGSPSITVATDELKINESIMAEVEIRGMMLCNPVRARASVSVLPSPIKLDRRMVRKNCGTPSPRCDGDMKVRIDPGRVADLKVSAGRFERVEDQYVWDLESAAVGRYEVSGTDPESKERFRSFVEVVGCGCPPECICPIVNIESIDSIRPGQLVRLGTSFVPSGVYINWKAEGADIVASEFNEIVIDIDPMFKGRFVTVTVEASAGNLCPNCPRTASKQLTILR